MPGRDGKNEAPRKPDKKEGAEGAPTQTSDKDNEPQIQPPKYSSLVRGKEINQEHRYAHRQFTQLADIIPKASYLFEVNKIFRKLNESGRNNWRPCPKGLIQKPKSQLRSLPCASQKPTKMTGRNLIEYCHTCLAPSACLSLCPSAI